MTSARTVAVCINPALDVSCDADQVRPTRKTRTTAEQYYPGGGGINVARVFNTLGGQVELLYVAGGATGDLLEDKLAELNIIQRRIRTTALTRVAFNVHERHSGFEYRFVPQGHPIGEDTLLKLQVEIDHCGLSKGDYLVASGSLPLDTAADTYARLSCRASACGVRVILDTSGEPLSLALSEGSPFLIKPSLRELERLAGNSLDEEDARGFALELIDRGDTQYVAVSMGSHGAFIACAKGVLRLPSRRVAVRSAVGAGDAFVGGMTWALTNDYAVDRAFAFGVAAGAAAVTTSGTQLCNRETMLKMYNAILSATELDWN